MRLLLATSNHGKIRELKGILGSLHCQLLSLNDIDPIEGVEETGLTFIDNALIKARHYFLATGIPSIADDSGLSVDALGGAPGVRSARYAGTEATDSERVVKILEEMVGVPDALRRARFICAAAIVSEAGQKTFTGEVEGVILREPRGANGFGYDPIFFYEPYGRAIAELSKEGKSIISHRGIAFRKLALWLESSLLS